MIQHNLIVFGAGIVSFMLTSLAALACKDWIDTTESPWERPSWAAFVAAAALGAAGVAWLGLTLGNGEAP